MNNEEQKAELPTEAGIDTNTVLSAVPSWEEYKMQNPAPPYRQEEKYGAYDLRVSQYYDQLYIQWLKCQRHSS